MDFSGFNWAEVFLSAMSAVVVAAVWYRLLFRARWERLLRIEDVARTSSSNFIIMIIAFALYAFTAMVMSLFIEIVMMIGSGASTGAAFGGLVAIAFVVPSFAVNNLLGQRSVQLFSIDASCVLIQLALMGAIMGAWL